MQKGQTVVNGRWVVTTNCVCPTNTFWNTTTRSCTVALKAAPPVVVNVNVFRIVANRPIVIASGSSTLAKVRQVLALPGMPPSAGCIMATGGNPPYCGVNVTGIPDLRLVQVLMILGLWGAGTVRGAPDEVIEQGDGQLGQYYPGTPAQAFGSPNFVQAVSVTVYRDGRQIAGPVRVSTLLWNQAVQIADQLGASARHYCSSTAYQAIQSCRLLLWNVPDLRVVQFLQVLGLFQVSKTIPTTFVPAGSTVYGVPGQVGQYRAPGVPTTVYVRLVTGARGQFTYAEGPTTRAQLNRALGFLSWNAPVNTTNSSPTSPVVLRVSDAQARQAAAIMGLPLHGAALAVPMTAALVVPRSAVRTALHGTVDGAPNGQLGNPASASIDLSIGVGGLLLFGLAAYGLWRVARG